LSRHHKPRQGSRKMRRLALFGAVRSLPLEATHRFVPRSSLRGLHSFVYGLWVPVAVKRGRGGRR
jgi:hypothetical protein